MEKIKKLVPFNFVLDLLSKEDPEVKPMFGSHAVYVRGKIMLVLREKHKDVDDGIWIATTAEHHASLKEEFPNIRSIKLFGNGPTSWQILPADAPDFEASADRACALILKGDVRIGKYTGKAQKQKNNAEAAAKDKADKKTAKAKKK